VVVLPGGRAGRGCNRRRNHVYLLLLRLLRRQHVLQVYHRCNLLLLQGRRLMLMIYRASLYTDNLTDTYLQTIR